MPAQIANECRPHAERPRHNLALQREIELLRIRRTEVRSDCKDAPNRVRDGGQVHNWKWQKPFVDAPSNIDVARAFRNCQPERGVAEKPQTAAFVSSRVIEDTVAAAKNSARRQLVCEAKTRTKVLVIRLDARIFVHPALSRDVHPERGYVEVGPAIRYFAERTVVIPAQAQIQGQLTGDAPVIGEVDPELGTSLARPVEGVIVNC